METLPEFLERQLRLRGWSERELARQAKVAGFTVGRALGRYPDKPISYDAIVALSVPLRTDPVSMLRMAGLLPRAPEQTLIEDQLLKTFRELPTEHQQNLLFFAEYLFTQRTRLFPLLVDEEPEEGGDDAASKEAE